MDRKAAQRRAAGAQRPPEGHGATGQRIQVQLQRAWADHIAENAADVDSDVANSCDGSVSREPDGGRSRREFAERRLVAARELQLPAWD